MSFGKGSAFSRGSGSAFSENPGPGPSPGPGPGPLYKACREKLFQQILTKKK